MGSKAWLFAVFAVLSSAACSGDSGRRTGAVGDSPATGVDDAGPALPDANSTGGGGGNTSGSGPNQLDSSVAGNKDAAAPGPGDQVIEYLTCKPEELNPVVDCLTVTCPMQADPISLTTCLLDDCAKLVEKVSPKCRDCVIAGVSQDTAGLVQNCLDTSAILGSDAGLDNPLPF